MQELERMRQLVEILDRAARAYYQESTEIMSNLEYDSLYDELLQLEEQTGVVLANSPTVRVGYEVLSELPKEQHPQRMLSLDKTKDVAALAAWLGNQEGLLSWKLDGLTIVLTYEGGTLQKAVTRGNGEIGEVVTANAKTFVNLPRRIPFTGRLVIRGEAVITYEDFEALNASIEKAEDKYKNPRNLCSGSVRQLNSEITASRKVNCFIFALIEAQGMEFTRRSQQMDWLEQQGFRVVERYAVTAANVAERVQAFSEAVRHNPVPSDGLVMTFEDIAYGLSLGTTAKFPRNSIAFKWADEQAETVLREIEWSPSRTGLLNPVAIFDPVELEGTTVTRASVHNLSIVEDLELGVGDRILVYKANMIIPQIAENLTRSGGLILPKCCPVCGQATKIQNLNGTRELMCENAGCPVKRLKRFSLFVSRDALNVEGMSEATLETLLQLGMLKGLGDLFRLEAHREQIMTLEGWGEKSTQNLLQAIERAKETTLPRVLYGLGIPGIGLAGAKVICRAFSYQIEAIMNATPDELTQIEGIGAVLAECFYEYMSSEENRQELLDVLGYVIYPIETVSEGGIFSGKTFVITGSLEHFTNRKELQALIEAKGGKVSGSVSAKTHYLINNDALSNSTKNKKARELGIPILTEAELLEQLQG